jgi:hypothetical protein
VCRRSDGRAVAWNQQENTPFFYGKGNANHKLGIDFFVHKRIVSAAMRVKSVGDRISYIVSRSHWCHIIELNFHAPTQDKTDDVKDTFYKELIRVFDKLPKYNTKIFLGDFNAKLGRENIFKPTTRNESLHETSSDNGFE